jgi:DNA-binding MarR family transcriptional regulator
MNKEDVHTLRLMGQIDRKGDYTQRELSHSLNLSLGLVNTYLRRLVERGYFRVETMPRHRVKYYLTPEGLARKSRLTAEYLRYSVDFQREIKKLILGKYLEMGEHGVTSLLFYGAGEVAELAYLYLQLTNIRLTGIVDNTLSGQDFFGHRVADLARLHREDWDIVLLTRLEDTEKDMKSLLERGIGLERIATI